MSGWRKRQIENKVEAKMKKRDRKNLQFLLSLDKHTMMTWWVQAPLADKLYAQELLDAYQKELDIATTLVYDGPIDSEFPDAKKILDKFRINS
jgi:transposase